MTSQIPPKYTMRLFEFEAVEPPSGLPVRIVADASSTDRRRSTALTTGELSPWRITAQSEAARREGTLRTLAGDELIVVTGGAGFIGSNIVNALAGAGLRVVISDLLRSGDKWRNIAAAQLHDIVRPNMLFEWLGRHNARVAAIIHMAAISSTTETDVDRFVTNNVRLTLDLWDWCAAN